MIVKGKVKNKDGSGEFGAKVYVSDSQSVITPKKIGTTTDTNGDFQLDISQKDGTYLTAKSISGAITKTPIIEGVSDYLLDLSLSKVTTIPEVKVTANKTAQQPINSAKNETKNETKTEVQLSDFISPNSFKETVSQINKELDENNKRLEQIELEMENNNRVISENSEIIQLADKQIRILKRGEKL